MEISVTEIGNLKGLIIPDVLLNELNIDIGDKLDITINNGQLVITGKPQYTLDELLAKCDKSIEMTAEMKEWEQAQPVGKEII